MKIIYYLFFTIYIINCSQQYKKSDEINSQDFESYQSIQENKFIATKNQTYSTFSIDVDTASYSNVRRFITNNMKPPVDSVRIEELVNYFDYDYIPPKNSDPFSVNTELSKSPWNEKNYLLRIGLKGKEIKMSQAPQSNLVFLIDVSGSMSDSNKLPLLKHSFSLLIKQLSKKDTVSIVVYAGAAGVVLPPTSCDEKNTILDALNKLESGGSTNGGEGIELAYKLAISNFKKNGINRVLIATDGDFNVGITSHGSLISMIEDKRKSGIFLSVLGFGMGNYKDSLTEQLANKGNGVAYYIDSFDEAKKVFQHDLSGTLITIAKDVKIQVKFNSQIVQNYRLIGYENRILDKKDFKDDTKDAGEIGAGHKVTALYELQIKNNFVNEDLFQLNLRYKKPDEDSSKEIIYKDKTIFTKFSNTSDDFKFASSVAMFGMLLRDSEFKGNSNYKRVYDIAKSAVGKDSNKYRAEFIELVKQAEKL